jgi:predicted aspartyl protease/tetratricopeptide (TPR) repeat protein
MPSDCIRRSAGRLSWRRHARPWIAALAAAVAIVAPGGARAEPCRLGRMELPVRMDGGRPIVTLGLNGTPVPLLLDTGAFFSLLTPSAAAQLHLPLQDAPFGLRVTGHTGDIDVRKTVVKSVQLQGLELADMEFLVGGNELGQGIMGVMGRNFLSFADNEFDLAHGLLRLVVPKGDCGFEDFVQWAGDAPVNVLPMVDTFRHRDSAIWVAVTVNDHRVKAMVDTGATTLIKRRAAHLSGIDDAQMTPVGRVGGGGEGHADAWTAPVAKLAIGGETVSHSVLMVDDADDGIDMLLGIDWLLAHHVYVARSQDKVYATWNGGPVFVRNVVEKGDAPDEARYVARPAAPAASDPQALQRSGEAAAARGDFASALADLDRACALAPADAACFVARAKVHVSMRQPQAALADTEQALRLAPADPATRLMRAELRLQLSDDRAGAIEDLRAVDESLPPQSHLHAEMGHRYAELDMPAEALRQWDLWMPAHQQDTARGSVLNQRCWMRMRLNLDLDRALEDCRGAAAEDRRNAQYRDSLGWVWLRRGQETQAMAEFTEAIELRPRSPWSLYGRGLARVRRGDAAAADTDFAAARQLDPGIDEAVRRAGLPVDGRARPAEAAAAASAAAGR